MPKSQSRTFELTLQNKEAAIISITATGSIQLSDGHDIYIYDSHGYLVAHVNLAMDVTLRTIHDSTVTTTLLTP